MSKIAAQLSQATQPTQCRLWRRESTNFRGANGDHAARPSKRFFQTALPVVLLLAAAVRLPGISQPLLGPFATKNAIYAMIARNWAAGRAPLWLPTVDCLSGGQRGLHLLELPLASYMAGAGWAICGGALDVWGRAVSIALGTAGVALLYLLVRRWHGERPAVVAATVLALSPISILCGRSFMLESSVVFLMLLSLWSVERWLAAAGWQWWLLTALSVAMMLCTKIYLIAMLLPLVWLCLRRIAVSERAQRGRWIAACLGMVAIGLAPAALWCLMVARIASPEHPWAQHVYYSLGRSTATHCVPSPLLWSSEFYVRLFKGMAGGGLTPIGFLLALIGLCHPAARRHFTWLTAMGLLIVLLPGKFFELRYYLLVLVPVCAVLAGLGCEHLARRVRTPRTCLACCLVCGFAGALWFGRPMWRTSAEDHAVTAAAAALRNVSASNEPVATLHGTAPDLLYYCDRPGWALSVNDPHFSQTLERCRRQGARWLVVADPASLVGKPAGASIGRLSIERAGDDFLICRIVPRPH